MCKCVYPTSHFSQNKYWGPVETVYFSFSDFSELIPEVAPLVLFRPAPYFMAGLEYKLVTIILVPGYPFLNMGGNQKPKYYKKDLKIPQEWDIGLILNSVVTIQSWAYVKNPVLDQHSGYISKTSTSNSDIILLLSVAMKVKEASGDIL